MSFILDALKKSEADRQKNTGPGLHELRVAAPRARFPIWAVLIAALLGINLLIGVWYLMRTDKPAPQTQAPANAAPAPAPAPAPATQNAAPAAAAIPSPDAGQPNVPPATSALPAPATDAGMGRSDVDRGIYNPADFEPAIEPEPATSAASKSRTAATRTPNIKSLPSRDDLVQEGVPVPEIAMSLHVFDPVPAQRFAFVNGSRVQEGDALPSGLVVESITPQGVVFAWRGRRFLFNLP